MEFTKLQIISKHFKRDNSDSEYIPRVRQQYEINLKPRTGFCSYCIEWRNLKCKISGNKWSHKPYRNFYLAERQSKDDRYDL